MDDQGLARENSKRGRLQREALRLLREHEAAGELPTSARFIFYELEQHGVVSKRRNGARRPDQDLSEAIKDLRDLGIVPWTWIVDETRALHSVFTAPSVGDWLTVAVESARIGPWGEDSAPMVLTESRSLAGVLRSVAQAYGVSIAATNGQVGGF